MNARWSPIPSIHHGITQLAFATRGGEQDNVEKKHLQSQELEVFE